ncbi:MAG TPA: protein-L-isoaspartate(D-aspartate) O-methyltransferase [Candidatus Udaeobacter sp.]
MRIVARCLLFAAIATTGCHQQTRTAADFAEQRQRMVEQQLKPRGIKDERVLAAMARVPREEFIPADVRGDAYEDGPLPIGYDQTISQPYIVAFMTEQLRPRPNDRVLEIGSGSGYQAAILANLVADVYTIEIVEPLAKTAEATLQRLGYKNVHIKVGDGYKGWPEQAPFDAIIVTCAPENVPQPLIDQLKDGGRMIIPVGERFAQQLYLLEKKNGQLKESVTLPVRFVPMLRAAEKK